MANRYNGDPNYNNNNPFLNLLEDVEEGLAWQDQQQAQVQQGQQASRAPRVKLPDFWPHAPAIWFARAELRFGICGVTSEAERFAFTADALPYETLRAVADLITVPPAVNPYTTLKERLLLSHNLTPLQKAKKVSEQPALGDRRPSQLLAALLEYCPEGEENTALFRAAFIHRLPTEIQVLLDGLETGDLKQLAWKADQLWLTRGSGQMHAVAALSKVAQPEVEEEGELVAAVKGQSFKHWREKKEKKDYGGRRDGGSGTSGSGGSNSGINNSKKGGWQSVEICGRHLRYGKDAWTCQDPSRCKFPGN